MIDHLPLDDEIHAYIDGELDEARAHVIAGMIEADAALALRVAAFRADQDQLRAVYGPLIAQPLPDQWIKTIEQHALKSTRANRPLFGVPRAVLAMAASLLLVALSWFAVQRFMPPRDDIVISSALSAWRDQGAVPKDSMDIPTWAMDSTLTSTLGVRLKSPDLSKMGFTLASARVYADAPGRQAVKLDYRDDRNRLVTLYLRKSSGAERFDMLKRDAVRICIWQDDVLSTVMLGEISAAEMLRLASLAYSGLNPGAA